MTSSGTMYVGDWPVDVTIAGDRAEYVVQGPRPRTFVTLTVTAEGIAIRGELPPLSAVQWSDWRDVCAAAGESLHFFCRKAPERHG